MGLNKGSTYIEIRGRKRCQRKRGRSESEQHEKNIVGEDNMKK